LDFFEQFAKSVLVCFQASKLDAQTFQVVALVDAQVCFSGCAARPDLLGKVVKQKQHIILFAEKHQLGLFGWSECLAVTNHCINRASAAVDACQASQQVASQLADQIRHCQIRRCVAQLGCKAGLLARRVVAANQNLGNLAGHDNNVFVHCRAGQDCVKQLVNTHWLSQLVEFGVDQFIVCTTLKQPV